MLTIIFLTILFNELLADSGWGHERCTLQNHFKVAKIMNTVDNLEVCSQLPKVISSMKKLETDCGYDIKQCDGGENPTPTCQYGTQPWNARPASALDNVTVCGIAQSMEYCYQKHCKHDSFGEVVSGNTCLGEAYEKCVSESGVEDATNDDVDAQTCRSVYKARDCFRKKAGKCEGMELDFLAVDVRVSGLDRHNNLCVNQGFVWNNVDAVCTFKEYVQCSGEMASIELGNVCSQLSNSVSCLEDLKNRCGYKICPGKHVASCQWDDSKRALRNNTRLYDKTACGIFTKMEQCHNSHCSNKVETFTEVDGFEGEICLKDAKRKCIDFVNDVEEVNQRTCRLVAEAKNCLFEELEYCSFGNELIENVVDIIIVGLYDHVRRCKEAGFFFSRDGFPCSPIPLDALLRNRRLMDSHFKVSTNLEACKMIEFSGDDLEDYLEQCYPSRYNAESVKKVLENLAKPRERCNDWYPNMENRGVKGHHSMKKAATAILFLLAFKIFQF